jgi:hypothetical protein
MTETPGRTELPLAVAVDLAHALVGAAAESAQVRALFIKGTVSNLHAVRPHRVPSDVDVLVPPEEVDRLLEALARRGWAVRPESFAHQSFVTHSVTVMHPDWPCDIDVHTAFPGFLADENVVFGALWARRQSVTIAHFELSGANFASSVVIAALHALRAMHLPRHAQEFDQALAAVKLSRDAADIVREVEEIADEGGARGTLAPFLVELGVAGQTPPVHDAKYQEWQRNTQQLNRAVSWLAAILEVPRWQRPAFVWRALFPGVTDLLLDHPETPRTAAGLTRTWLTRFLGAARAFPRAIMTVLSQRRVVAAGPSLTLGSAETFHRSRRLMPETPASPANPEEPQQISASVDSDSIPQTTVSLDCSWLTRASDVAQVDHGGSTYVMSTAGGGSAVPLLLEGSGSEIWTFLRAPISVSSLFQKLADEHRLPVEEVRPAVLKFVECLVEADVLKIGDMP